MTRFPDEPSTWADPPAPDEPGEAAARSPAARRARRDRWAHRRGEPRVFAFLWTVYLFIATTLTLARLGTGGPITLDLYRPAARLLLIWVAAGIALVWPLVRLSQAAPPRPVSASFKDLLVVVIPAQAVIWPQWWLAHWPLPAVAAISALYAAWASIVAALLALALAGGDRHAPPAYEPPGPSGTARAAWMLVLVLLAVGGPAAMLLGGGLIGPTGVPPPLVRPEWMVSPLTATYEITRDRYAFGATAMAAPEHWAAIGLTAVASVPLWIAAAVRTRGRAGAAGLH